MLNKVQTTLIPPSTLIFSGDGLTGDENLERALTSNGLTSYFQSLNTGSGNLRVQMTIRGAFSVLPWHTFQFDSRADERYQDRQFRPTTLAYDFAKDEVEITAYQITSDTTPTYTTSPFGRQWYRIPFNGYTPPEFVVYRNGKAASDVFSREGKIKSAVEVEPGGNTGTLSDYAKRVDNTVSTDFKIKSAVAVEPGGADGTLSKKLAPITSDGRISKDAQIEVGGPDGTLSKRIKNLDNSGKISRIAYAGYFPLPFNVGKLDNLDTRGLSFIDIILDPQVGTLLEITGILSYNNGESLRIYAKTGNILLSNENTDSDIENRFGFGNDVYIPEGAYADIFYNNGKWRTALNSYGNTFLPYIELPQETTDINNYNIGDGTNYTISTDSGSISLLTGIANGLNGRTVNFTNRGPGVFVFVNQSSSSDANNRILSSSGDVTLDVDETITLCYDSSVSRWRIQQIT